MNLAVKRLISTSFAVVFCAVALLCMYQGALLLAFEPLASEAQMLVASLKSPDVQERAKASAGAGDFRTRLASWRNTAGVQGRARRLVVDLDLAANPVDARVLAQSAADVLTIEPTSGIHWLVLAGARYRLGQPMESVLGAVHMSMLVAPREGEVMIERAKFLFQLWEKIGPDDRLLALRHLAQFGRLLNNDLIAQFKAIFAMRPAASLVEIRSQLKPMLAQAYFVLGDFGL